MTDNVFFFISEVCDGTVSLILLFTLILFPLVPFKLYISKDREDPLQTPLGPHLNVRGSTVTYSTNLLNSS